VSRGIALRRALTIFAFTLALTGLACILAAAGVAEVGNRTLIAGFVFFGVAAVLAAWARRLGHGADRDST